MPDIGFLRTEVPTILATRTDAPLPRMLPIIEEPAGDWRGPDDVRRAELFRDAAREAIPDDVATMNSRPSSSTKSRPASLRSRPRSARATSKRMASVHQGFAPRLERIETIIEPEGLAKHVGKRKVLIGEDVSERLDVVLAKFRAISRAAPSIPTRTLTAHPGADPTHIIEGGIPTEALLALIAPGGHLRSRQGRTRPRVNGSMDGQARLRTRGRLHLQRDQEG